LNWQQEVVILMLQWASPSRNSW